MADGPPFDGARPVPAALEDWLAALTDRLELDRERRRLIADEIRGHVSDAVDAHVRRGLGEAESVRRAIRDLGAPEALAVELEAVHAGDAAREALRFVILPVFLALIVRFGALSLDGRSGDWTRLAATVPFALLATCALVGPLLALRRERFAAASWSVFWVLTVLLLVAA